jgi:hypothetical protein
LGDRRSEKKFSQLHVALTLQVWFPR